MSRSRVKWNEDNIAEIEANKPVRQKITEPKTPYHPMIDDEECVDPSSPSRSGGFGDYFEDALNILATSSSLNDVGSSSKSGSHLSDWTSSDDDTEAMDQDSDSERCRSFKEHRKDHYDEFLKVKELRRNGSHLEDASDDEPSITAGVKDIDIEEPSRPENGS
ncbi:protein phosphatase inhibitor 2-like isoform X3 [Salvia hispanica]|uniref:protein phosphatase inhibitor 2-like isoform X3 n=1 Tax=Salvia hispanica TaxID=49212 RepID=UPI002008FCC6|nr:protein phosphatase inhibitor 2-like isoform X3 [Salvia hispanica]